MKSFTVRLPCFVLGVILFTTGCNTFNPDPSIEELTLTEGDLPERFAEYKLEGMGQTDRFKSFNESLVPVFDEIESTKPECINTMRAIRLSPEPNGLFIAENDTRFYLNWISKSDFNLDEIANSIRGTCSNFFLTSEPINSVPAHTQDAIVEEIDDPVLDGTSTLIIKLTNTVFSDGEPLTAYELYALSVVNGYAIRVYQSIPTPNESNDAGTPIFNEWISDIKDLVATEISKINSLT